MSVIDKRMNRIVGDWFGAHYAFERQRRQLETLRDREGIVTLTDEAIEQAAALDPVAFARREDEIRMCYARRDRSIFGPVAPVGGPTPDQVRRAVALTTSGVSLAEAMEQVRGN